MQGYWSGVPDLVTEVVSPSDLYTEGSEKVAEWLQAGAKMVVVVNAVPGRCLFTLAHGGEGARSGRRPGGR